MDEQPRLDPAIAEAVLAAQTISIDQVTALLDEAILRDQRNAGASDIRAWWVDLNLAHATVTYGKAMAALSYYYAVEYPSLERDQRRRVEAADIIRLVRKLEEEATRNFVFQPEHTDTPDETIARRAAQRAGLINGSVTPAPIGQAQRNPVYQLPAVVSGAPANTHIPEDDDLRRRPLEIQAKLARRHHPARSIYCPSCHAAPGAPCENLRGQLPGGHLHPSRIDTFAVKNAQCEECDAPIGEVCRDYPSGLPYGRVHAPRLAAAKCPNPAQEAA